MTKALQGKGVLVTRPAGQADTLRKLIETEGGRVFRFPVLEIADIENTSQLQQQYQRLADFDIAIFVSVNAVRKTVQCVLAGNPWPAQVAIAAVGPSTVQALDKLGLSASIYPAKQFDSEGLLNVQALQKVDGKKIVIFRGEGGRRHLGDTLLKRGAEVEYLEVYKRTVPAGDITGLLRHFESGDIDVITVNSSESLSNLIQMVGATGQQWLHKLPMIVINNKMLERVREMGSKVEPVQAESATDQAVVEALLGWSRS